jgi:mRNA degradation ribonuclease J1/J2
MIHVSARQPGRTEITDRHGAPSTLPIHGELRQLIRHENLPLTGTPGENVIVVENGQLVELSGGKIRLGERIPGGYVFVDGQSIGDIDYDIMREREKLACNGIFLIDISSGAYSGRLSHEPEITRALSRLKTQKHASCAQKIMDATAVDMITKRILPPVKSYCMRRPNADRGAGYNECQRSSYS